MIFISFLKLIVFFFSLRSTGVDDEFQSYISLLEGKYGCDFDFEITSTFLSSTDSVSCFSPYCSEIALYTESFILDNDQEKKFRCKRHLLYLLKTINQFESSGLKVFNNAYLYSETLYTFENSDMFIYQEYNDINAQDVFIGHYNWVKSRTSNNMYTSTTFNHFIDRKNIFEINVCFHGNIYEHANFDCVCKFHFYLENDIYCTRDFFNKLGHFYYNKIQEDGINFEIIIVPCSEYHEILGFNRVMIYLIPETYEVNLTTLWNKFQLLHEQAGDIKSIIKNCQKKFINLYVPKINKFTSNFNISNLFNNFIELSTNNNFSIMNTCINIDDEKIKNIPFANASLIDEMCSDEDIVKFVKADVPHIVFIYDMTASRILFVIKDNGNFKE